MSQATPDRRHAVAEMEDLCRRARAAGDVEILLIAKMVEGEVARLRAERPAEITVQNKPADNGRSMA